MLFRSKGSVNHNSRKFRAENVDGTRTHLNIDYCNENIKTVYHELFDEALERYNAKQTRSDRKIKDYYEKIRSSKQEKLFHEIILQVGGKGNMNADTENGELAKQILDEYYQGFQERNPQLRVFSAHLHMDEATPHLHIDFVPFTTESKRGLDTRVSLKQALAAQGFKGGTRGDTEWSQWVQFEKEQLAAVMERYGIEWEHKGAHENCRLGCAAILKTMHTLAGQELNVDIVGACAAQEEVGVRGATVTAQVIKPDIAIVFEGCPADDTCVESYMVQTAIKRGPMLRHIDARMITNPHYQRYALDLAEKLGIPVQDSVRSSGSTNGAAIHLTEKAVPVIVIGVPVRYAHTHYGISAYADFDNAVKLACEILKRLDEEQIMSF